MKKEQLFDIIGAVDEHKIAAAGMALCAKKPPRPVWLKLGAVAAGLLLVAVGVFVGGMPEAHIAQPGNEIIQPGKTSLLVVNEAESITSADLDVQFSFYNQLSAPEWQAVLKEFETAVGFGYDDFTAKISDVFVKKSFYSVDAPADAEAAQYVPHDYVFEYQTQNGGDVRIAICSDEKPLRDCFIECDNAKQSEINGVSAVIYGYQGTFIAELACENVNYEIEASNITLKELEDLLTGITE